MLKTITNLLLRRKHPVQFVSYYTDDDYYSACAKRLIESANRFSVSIDMRALSSVGSWEQNCAHKSKFIKDRWEESDIPIVWVDADATFEASPSIFADIDADFGIHKWEGWQFGTGTIYFGKSERARDLLDRWVLRCEADPDTWDQVHLQSAWCDLAAKGPLKTEWLPRTYLQIFDAPELEPPIIKHWQASRKIKAERTISNKPYFGFTEEGVEDRRNNRLWRTAEEAFWISEGTAHIKPEIGTEFPEGFDVSKALRDSIDGAFPVLEFGCGVGRIASLFDPEEYIGIDINPNAIRQARLRLPSHNVRIYDRGNVLPAARSAMVYTVLLHVADDMLETLMQQIAIGRHRIVIAELMDPRWRRDGNPPVFNRNPEDYILLMQRIGFTLVSATKYAYERYDKEPANIGRDSRITFLAFDAAS